MVSGILIMVFNIIQGLRKGKPAPANPWGGTTLEWQIASPPPVENFDVIPTVTRGPYERDEHYDNTKEELKIENAKN